MISCYYSNVVFDNRSLVSQLILAEMRWKELCQAALLLCLCSGTLQAGGEQKAPLWSSCLQCTQLPAVYTAVSRVQGAWLSGTQLSTWHTAVSRVQSCLQDVPVFAWHTALPGTQLSQGAQLSQSAQLLVGCTDV